MSQSLTLVLQAAVSLRGAAAIFAHLPRLSYDPQGDWPSPGTIQMWLLRLGLDALQQPLEQADDWAWLADHTVQIGKTKCLLIVGVRLSKWRELGGELTHHDLSVIALEPVEHSDGETVHRQLEAAVSRTGLPQMIASDHGSDLKKGIAAFQEQHPQVTGCYDIAHKVALLLKKILEGDARWAEFTQQCGQAKSRLQQTSLAHLIPPPIKPKARYMNADRQVHWGLRVLQMLDRRAISSPDTVDGQHIVVNETAETSSTSMVSLNTEPIMDSLAAVSEATSLDTVDVPDTVDVEGVVVNETTETSAESTVSFDTELIMDAVAAVSEAASLDDVEPDSEVDLSKDPPVKVLDSQLREKFGWVRTFAESLASWSRLMVIAAITRHYVRHQGYHADAAEQLQRELSPHRGDVLGDQLIDQVCSFVAEQSTLAAPGERILGSTEILESLIGKGKRLEGQQSKGGFTKMVLSLAAATVAPTVERLKTALERTLTKHVLRWTRTHIPISLQAQRRAELPPIQTGTKTG